MEDQKQQNSDRIDQVVEKHIDQMKQEILKELELVIKRKLKL